MTPLGKLPVKRGDIFVWTPDNCSLNTITDIKWEEGPYGDMEYIVYYRASNGGAFVGDSAMPLSDVLSSIEDGTWERYTNGLKELMEAIK